MISVSHSSPLTVSEVFNYSNLAQEKIYRKIQVLSSGGGEGGGGDYWSLMTGLYLNWHMVTTISKHNPTTSQGFLNSR